MDACEGDQPKKATLSTTPDFSAALTKLRFLGDNEVNIAEALDHFAETGLPLLVIDHFTADAAGNLFIAYKLADELAVSLAAVRAQKAEFEKTGLNHDGLFTAPPIESGVDHQLPGT